MLACGLVVEGLQCPIDGGEAGILQEGFEASRQTLTGVSEFSYVGELANLAVVESAVKVAAVDDLVFASGEGEIEALVSHHHVHFPAKMLLERAEIDVQNFGPGGRLGNGCVEGLTECFLLANDCCNAGGHIIAPSVGGQFVGNISGEDDAASVQGTVER